MQQRPEEEAEIALFPQHLDWQKLHELHELHELHRQNPWLLRICDVAYRSLYIQMALIPAILLFAMPGKGWWLMNAWAISCVVTVLIFPLVPAVGANVYFGISRTALPGLGITWPWTFGSTIAGVRSGHITEVTQAMSGLVSFPSFHSTAAILFAWAAWPSRVARWPVVILNAAMLFSTLIRGGHYLIDMVGGIAVAVFSLWFAQCITEAMQMRTGRPVEFTP